jgi:hypothetical protein
MNRDDVINSAYLINPLNYMNVEYSNYLEDIRLWALGSPTNYYKCRRELETKIRNEATKLMYKTIVNALTKGNTDGSNTPTLINGVGLSEALAPNFANNEASQIALNICSTVHKALDSVVELIMPRKFNDVMDASVIERTGLNTTSTQT